MVIVSDHSDISIHVLREEDDYRMHGEALNQFQFLSTSSARRTTQSAGLDISGQAISIHVLREEDD